MKRGGPRNIVIQSGDFMTATLEGPSMVDYYGIGFLRHAGMGSFKKMLAWLQNSKKPMRCGEYAALCKRNNEIPNGNRVASK